MGSTLILTLACASSIILFTAWLVWRTFNVQKQKIQKLEKTLGQITQDYRVQTASVLNMGERLKRLERRTYGHVSAGAASDKKDDEPSDVAYTQAAKLLEQGATVEDIMEKCNISQSEAELIESLYQQMQDADIVN